MDNGKLSPPFPGGDSLDAGVEHLRAIDSLCGVLADALEAIGSRFLVLGGAIAVIDARGVELEKRDNINWPALDERLKAIEARLAQLEAHP